MTGGKGPSWRIFFLGLVVGAATVLFGSELLSAPKASQVRIFPSASERLLNESTSQSPAPLTEAPTTPTETPSTPTPTAAASTPNASVAEQPRVVQYARLLPKHASLFCPAFDDALEMTNRWRPENMPASFRRFSLNVEGCPAPARFIALRSLEPKETNPKVIKRLRKMLLPKTGQSWFCAALRLHRTTPHAVFPAASDASDAQVAAMPIERDAAVARHCAAECFTSPCCLAFQILGSNDVANGTNGRARQCRLYSCRRWDRGATMMTSDHLLDRDIAMLEVRHEVRPSLVNDAPRLVFSRGFGDVLRVAPATGQVADSAEQSIEVSAYGAFGRRLTLPISAPLECAVRRVPVRASGSDDGDALLIRSISTRLTDGRASFPTAAVLGDMRTLVGTTVEIVCTAEAPRTFNDDGTPLAVTNRSAVFPRLSLATPPMRFAVHYLSARAELRYTGGQLPPHARLRHGADDCAPHLRRGECCLSGLSLVSVDAYGRSGGASLAQNKGLMLRLRIEPPHPCIFIVDGNYSDVSDAGVAVFESLVLRNRCLDGNATALKAALANPETQHVRFLAEHYFRCGSANAARPGDVWAVTASVPLAELAGCGDFTPPAEVRAKLAAAAPEPPLRVGPLPRKNSDGPVASFTLPAFDDVNDPPILVSLRVHEQMDVIGDLLENLRVFLWPSIVMLHVSPEMGRVNASMLAAFAKFNYTKHPRVLVNPFQSALNSLHGAHIHALNVHYAINVLNARFSHVLLLATNEMFVRRGAVEYIRQFDLSSPLSPPQRGGLLWPHDANGYRANTRFEEPEVQQRRAGGHELWFHTAREGAVSEFHFAAAMRRANVTRVNSQPLPLEGVYFRRDLAAEWAAIFQEVMPDREYCLESSWMATSEVIGLLLLSGKCGGGGNEHVKNNSNNSSKTASLRCGLKVSTLVWSNNWWFATPEDLRWLRCTPFGVPFAFKRVLREYDHPLRSAIRAIQRDVARASIWREEGDAACPLGYELPEKCPAADPDGTGGVWYGLQR